MSLYPIEVVNLGQPTFDMHYEVINDLNSIQDSFKYILPNEENRSWGSKLDEDFYNTDMVWKSLKGYREVSKGFHPFIIAIVHKPLSSKRLQNIFGSIDKKENFAVFTTYQWDTLFAPPPLRVYLTYYLINYTIRFLCHDIEAHETRNCFFDKKINKNDIKLSMISGNICKSCQQLLLDSIDSNAYYSILKLIEYMKNSASNSSKMSITIDKNVITPQDTKDCKIGISSKSITWLHISDLHFSTKDSHDSNFVTGPLLKDISRFIERKIIPDFIIVSGDIASSGQTKEYKKARTFFQELLEITNVDLKHLILVPGNHDVDRNVIKTSDLAVHAKSIYNTREAVNRLFEKNKRDRNIIFKRFHNYRKFIDTFFESDTPYRSKNDYYYVKEIHIADMCIHILGLNSAWLAGSDGDRCELVLGENQVSNALNDSKNADLRIAVMHHPFDWFMDFDRTDVEPLLSDGCDYILHGHMHRTNISLNINPDIQTRLFGAGACYEARDFPNSYNLVRLDLDTGLGTAYLRAYSNQQGGFWTENTMTYRNASNGEYQFELPIKFRRSVQKTDPGV